ncbi:MAG: 50S ribosomal protein L25/general stress protein Ctc [Microbacteriaceae bacterium]|nr:50S ribosomal protein L25/general stress protein Ctc [Microbacteriaceae bacterium]
MAKEPKPELDNKLDVDVRTSFGKGAARKIRANDRIPAVLYGHGTDPQHLTLPGHKTMLLLRKANALLELNIDGGEEQLALVKDVQRDPVRQIIEHVDLLIVKKGERVEVEVPIVITGEPFSGYIVLQDANSILVSAEATHIPESIEVSVEGLQETTILATEVELPKGTKLVDEDVEIVIATVSEPQAVEEDEDGEDAAEAPAEDAE